MTYLGYTVEAIESLLLYDPDTGKFTSRISGYDVVGRHFSYRNRKTGKVVTFNLATVAVMLVERRCLDSTDRVVCKDGDRYNLAYGNLVVVDHMGAHPKKNFEKNTYLETEEDYIFYGTMNRLFVVRRGPEQSIYRTYSKKKAIEVRDRWLDSGKVLNEWDETMPVFLRK